MCGDCPRSRFLADSPPQAFRSGFKSSVRNGGKTQFYRLLMRTSEPRIGTNGVRDWLRDNATRLGDEVLHTGTPSAEPQQGRIFPFMTRPIVSMFWCRLRTPISLARPSFVLKPLLAFPGWFTDSALESAGFHTLMAGAVSTSASPSRIPSEQS